MYLAPTAHPWCQRCFFADATLAGGTLCGFPVCPPGEDTGFVAETLSDSYDDFLIGSSCMMSEALRQTGGLFQILWSLSLSNSTKETDTSQHGLKILTKHLTWAQKCCP
jgi:hypothetical protein